MLALVSVSGAAAATGTTQATAFPVTITAANGKVTIPRRPTRIVSLSPTSTESLFAIGAGRQVIAVDDQSDYPKNAPKTALSGFTPNVEAIAAYRPDLVIVAVQPEGSRLGADEARHPGGLPQAVDHDPGRLPADPPAGHVDGPWTTGRDARLTDEGADRADRREAQAGGRRCDGVPRARSELLLRDVEHVRRARLLALRPEERRRRGSRRLRLPSAVAGVHRLVEPGSGRARGLGLLRSERGHGRLAARLVGHQGGAEPVDPADRRLHRVPLGPEARELRPRRGHRAGPRWGRRRRRRIP